MVRVVKSTKYFELFGAIPGYRQGSSLKKSSKYLVLLAICAIFIRLNCRI